MNRYVVAVALTLTATGCAAPNTQFQNAGGQTANCSAAGFGLAGTAFALMSHQDCVNRMRAAGFTEVGQAIANPQPSPHASSVSMALPTGWEPKDMTPAMISGGSTLHATNRTTDSSFVLSAADKNGITDVTAYANARRAALQSHLITPSASAVQSVEVAGKPAKRYTVSGSLRNGLAVTYLVTIIEGTTQLVMLNSWTSTANYAEQKAALEQLPTLVTGI